MKIRNLFLLIITTTLISLTSCRQIRELNRLAKCQFRLQEISNTKLGNTNLQNVSKLSDIGILSLAKLTTGFATGSLPLKFTANIEVKNPNQKLAALNKIEWIAYFDDIELVKGSINKRVEIAPNKTAIIPINIECDIRKILSKKSLDALINLALNLSNTGNSSKSNIGIKIKPSIRILNKEISYPSYFKIEKEFSSN